jgi:hypothetical protein
MREFTSTLALACRPFRVGMQEATGRQANKLPIQSSRSVQLHTQIDRVPFFQRYAYVRRTCVVSGLLIPG